MELSAKILADNSIGLAGWQPGPGQRRVKVPGQPRRRLQPRRPRQAHRQAAARRVGGGSCRADAFCQQTCDRVV